MTTTSTRDAGQAPGRRDRSLLSLDWLFTPHQPRRAEIAQGPAVPAADYANLIRAAAVATALAVLGVTAVALWGMAGPTTTITLLVAAAFGAAASVVLVVVAPRLAREPHHLWPLTVVWSLTYTGLLSAAVAVTGGASSEFAFLYALLVVLFSVAYPARGQPVLLALVLVGFVAAAAASGAPIEPGDAAMRVAVMLATFVLTSYLHYELRQHAEAHRQAEMHAERRAQLLAIAALATRGIHRLDGGEVVDGLLRGALSFGVDHAGLFEIAADGATYTCRREVGEALAPEGPIAVTVGIVGLAAITGETQVADDYPAALGATPEATSAGVAAAVTVPVTVDDTVVAVLGVATLRAREFTAEEVEAFELLAAYAGQALANVRRFDAERDARRRLEELDRLQEDFLSTVSHELRTPVTIIDGGIELLHRRWRHLDPDTVETLLNRVSSHSQDLTALVERLRAFWDLQQRTHVDREAVAVHALLGDIVAELRGDADVAVQGEGTALADRALLQRALAELVHNAVRHTPPGTTVRIAISHAAGAAGPTVSDAAGPAASDMAGAAASDVAGDAPSEIAAGTVTVAVTDNGPGMTSEEADAAADRFRRGGQLLTRPTRGLGLGLSIARTVVEGLLDGQLRLHSVAGRGTRASIHLPAAPAPTERPAPGRDLTSAGGGRPAGRPQTPALRASPVLQLRHRPRSPSG